MPVVNGVPDLLSRARLDRNQAEAKRELSRLQIELSTGERQDKVAATGGDPSRLLSIDRSLAAVDARKSLLSLGQSRARGTQDALQFIDDATDEVAVRLRGAVGLGDLPSAEAFGAQAGAALDAVVSALNTKASGRSLFAGAAVDRPALAPADELVDDVRAILAAGPDVATINADLDLYFGDPTREFATQIFLGDAVEDAPPVEIDENERAAYAVRADEPALKDLMRNLAVAAAVEDANLSRDDAMQLYDEAGAGVLAARDELTTLRATLGMSQERIDDALVRTEAERHTLNLARNDLVGVDEFEAANEVLALETRLQALYSVTARASRLSLLNFLR